MVTDITCPPAILALPPFLMLVLSHASLVSLRPRRVEGILPVLESILLVLENIPQVLEVMDLVSESILLVLESILPVQMEILVVGGTNPSAWTLRKIPSLLKTLLQLLAAGQSV